VSNQLFLYQGFTLVDITPTGQTSYSPEKEFARNQQRNWETISQIISLRTQPEIIETSDTITNLDLYSFGINYVGQHRVWSFMFGVEYRDIYKEGPDIFGLLKSDFKITPITLKLTETAEPPHAIFYTSGPWNNIYFKSLKN
jgi:hypothetical protein